jgi:2-polyprenyl-3-methyl-5-hydroxy-6-metoxy-1,4-benzoquinol methylase
LNSNATERYPVKTDRHSSHSQILKECSQGNGRRLLDVGCARGHLAKEFVKQGWVVTGVEYNQEDAEIARKEGIDVIVGSAESAFSNISESFDVIVFADVLEHLVDPHAILQLAKQRLTPDGRIVISIPNIAHLTIRIQLLLGSFNYADRGILDRTHLHFYTKKSLREMITAAGLQTVHLGATPAPVEEVFPALRKIAPLRLLLELNALIAKSWKSALAYQYIAVAKTL